MQHTEMMQAEIQLDAGVAAVVTSRSVTAALWHYGMPLQRHDAMTMPIFHACRTSGHTEIMQAGTISLVPLLQHLLHD